ncbi:TrkH family potassium uptake protein [Staphylococcus condimenti]|uniref:TrkH family potassium uptake protein n=1 Tax=Staphylococcus condimenti TaxID=70255 RepID=A0A143P9V8_9STAP|nr:MULTISPECIES: TrkH family potassium uptake protein [Staphylococcus]AMY05292.1 Trk family potassium uptake protein [Staphylococcus condimenti]APR61499.1 Ktr system potassium uptake protein D [Staphylococcus condimenti]MDK8645301.1 TrkH family potassium uptake protein [Staphylococcus condimenti]OFO98755.1 ATP synthase [Staphylococcus sp. HMSC065E08]PNZ58361.1 TrkH family potassium uptake protein [Staphylococcus condimenti]
MSIFNQLFKRTSPQQGIVMYYLIAIVAAFLMLNLPYVHKPGVHVNPIDTLFVAVSGISVTGLTPISIVDTYSTFGQIIILIILNIGGVGVMAMGTVLWLVLGKRIGLRERQLIMLDNNRNTMSGAVKLIIEIVRAILLIELVGALLLAFYFYRDTSDIQYALMQGFFVAISSTTNAGLDITGNSLIPYADDYFVQTIVMFLITLGSIGFPVLLEVKAYIKNRIPNFRFSLFAKITTITYFVLFAFGTIVILLLEANHAFQGSSWHKALFYAMFQSTTTRSAGLETIDITHFSDATNILMGLLMFIGSSPSSVGGGIRTTTFAILILFIINFRNDTNNTTIKVFNREIQPSDIQKTFTVFGVATILTSVAIILTSAFEGTKLTFLQVFFEIMSAFGTCGLSLGASGDGNDFTKVVLMILMFIGRVGLISFIIMIGGRKDPVMYHYPKEKIQIG